MSGGITRQSITRFKLRVLELQDIAVFFHRTLQIVVKTGIGLGLNFDGDFYFNALACGKQHHHVVHKVGKLFLGLDRIKLNVCIKVALGRFHRFFTAGHVRRRFTRVVNSAGGVAIIYDRRNLQNSLKQAELAAASANGG